MTFLEAKDEVRKIVAGSKTKSFSMNFSEFTGEGESGSTPARYMINSFPDRLIETETPCEAAVGESWSHCLDLLRVLHAPAVPAGPDEAPGDPEATVIISGSEKDLSNPVVVEMAIAAAREALESIPDAKPPEDTSAPRSLQETPSPPSVDPETKEVRTCLTCGTSGEPCLRCNAITPTHYSEWKRKE